MEAVPTATEAQFILSKFSNTDSRSEMNVFERG